MAARLFLATALSAVIIPSAPLSASEQVGAPLDLKVTTVITGDHMFAVPVHLSEAAVLDLSVTDRGGRLRATAMHVEGGDEEHYTGVLLTEPDRTDGFTALILEPPDVPASPAGVVAHGIPHESDRPRPDEGLIPSDEVEPCQQCRMPAGDYELVIVASAPVTIRLTLASGPSGISHIDKTQGHPAEPAIAELHFASGRSSGDPLAYQAGMSADLDIGSSQGWLIHHWDLSATAMTTPATVLEASACLEEHTGGLEVVGDRHCEGKIGAFDDSVTFSGTAARAVQASEGGRVIARLDWTLVGGSQSTGRYGYAYIPVGTAAASSTATTLSNLGSASSAN